MTSFVIYLQNCNGNFEFMKTGNLSTGRSKVYLQKDCVVELINLRIYVRMGSVNLLPNIVYKLELPIRYFLRHV